MDNKKLVLYWGSRYLKEGWSIIPVLPKSKEPLIDWKPYQTKRATEAELQKWVTTWNGLNLGVITGPISNLAVIDADGPAGLTSLRQLKLTSTVIARTGNGKQVFYKWQEGVKNSVKKIAPGLDVRGGGGFVVVAPSIHPMGRLYRWERFVPATMNNFPTEILSVPFAGSQPVEKSSDLNYTEKPDSWIKDALEEMKNGHVHNNLVSVLGKFRAHNFSIDDTFALLKPYAFEKGQPFEGLKDKITEIWGRYEPRTTNAYGSIQSRLSIKSPSRDRDYEAFESSRREIKSSGLRTGFSTLDNMLQNGLKSERLFTLAARTGTGKTNFAIALAKSLCDQNKTVLYFSTEFQYSKIWSRYLAYFNGSGDIEKFRGHPFYVCDSFSPNLGQIEEAIKEVKPDVFIFDHINHIGEERESLGQFMQGCNFLQRKYETQGVMIAQLNRQADWVENGKRIEPRMSMIKGSGTIEQASSRVLLLSEQRITPEYNEILGVLDKNDSGDRGLLNFALYKNPFQFKELKA